MGDAVSLRLALAHDVALLHAVSSTVTNTSLVDLIAMCHGVDDLHHVTPPPSSHLPRRADQGFCVSSLLHAVSPSITVASLHSLFVVR